MKNTKLYYSIPSNFDLGGFVQSLVSGKMSETYRRINNGETYQCSQVLTCKQRIKYTKINQFVLELLTRLSCVNYNKEEEGIQLYSLGLRKLYSGYNTVINELIERGVVKRTKGYSNFGITGVCKKYSLTPKYRKRFKKIPVKQESWDEIYSRVIDRGYKKDKSQTQEDVLKGVYEFITKRTDIHDPNWMSLPMEVSKVEDILTGFTKLRNGVFDIQRKGKGNRVYHVLSFIPKEGRKYIVHKEYGEMVGVDVSSSHLTIICSLMEFDRERLQELLSQDFYTSISNGKYPRETIKNQFMKYLYGSNYKYREGRRRRRETELDRCMKLKLPHLHRYIMGMSKKDKRKLSHQIMEVESDLIVSQVGGQLLNMGIDFYPVHDCIYVPRQFTEMVQKLIVETFQGEIHVTPRVKIG
jgi:hypothetical protein